MPLEPESDLDWTAFLYVAGELSLEESSNFESLLLDDQDAREAVAAAVELAEALAILGSEPLPIARKRSTRRMVLWAASLAAAACLAAVIIPSFRPSEPDASAVAQAWSGLRVGDDPEWVAFVEGSPVPEPSTSGQITETDDAEGIESSADRPLPSWLLSAASVPRSDATQEEN